MVFTKYDDAFYSMKDVERQDFDALVRDAWLIMKTEPADENNPTLMYAINILTLEWPVVRLFPLNRKTGHRQLVSKSKLIEVWEQ